MDYDVVASSSKGNCIRFGTMIYDCGISFKKVKENIDLKNINFIFYSHVHGDHFKLSTLKKILEVNRKIKVFAHSEVAEILTENGIDYILTEISKEYTMQNKKGLIYKIKPIQLYHDKNCVGIKLTITDFFEEFKIFVATDTHTLSGIEAKDYDYYFLESNYTDENICSHDRDRVIGTHLSKNQAENFFISNKKEDSKFIGLHQSNRNY